MNHNNKKVMAYKKRQFKKRKLYRRKRIYKKRGARVASMKALVIPDKALVTLPYSDYKQFVGNTANIPIQWKFRMNSLFDPDLTYTGHQPLGFDQWKTFYNRYRVYKVAYRITFVNVENKFGLQVGVFPDNSGSYTTFTELSEVPRVKTALIPYENQKVFTGYFCPRTTVGLTKQQYMADDRYAAVYDSNPAESVDFVLWANSAENGWNTGCYVKLTYYAELFDRQQLPSS